MLHVISVRFVARDSHTIAPWPLECTRRQFVAQRGDCKNLGLRLSVRLLLLSFSSSSSSSGSSSSSSSSRSSSSSSSSSSYEDRSPICPVELSLHFSSLRRCPSTAPCSSPSIAGCSAPLTQSDPLTRKLVTANSFLSLCTSLVHIFFTIIYIFVLIRYTCSVLLVVRTALPLQ